MPESIDRRAMLSALVGAGLGLSAMAPAHAAQPPDGDPDEDSDPGNDVEQQIKRLAKVSEILGKANERLDTMLQNLTVPPPAAVPAHLTLLVAIRAQAEQIVQVTDTLFDLMVNTP